MLFSKPRDVNEINFYVCESKWTHRVFLGTAILSLKNIINDTTLDLWIPFEGDDLNANCKVHVLLRIHTFSIPKITCKSIPELNICLEKIEYYPGETVRGYASFYPTKVYHLRGMRLSFHGISTTYNYFYNGTYTQKTANIGRIIHSIATLQGNPIESKVKYDILPGSQYIYYFEYVLPSFLPASFKFHKGKNRYRFSVYLDQVGIDLKCRKKIKILPLIPPNPNEVIHTKYEDKGVNIEARMRKSLVQGVDHTVHIKIHNGSDLTLRKMKVKVMQKKQFRRELFRHYSCCVSHTYREGFPILPGQTYEGDIKLRASNLLPNIEKTYSRLAIETKLFISLRYRTFKIIPRRIQTSTQMDVVIPPMYTGNIENTNDDTMNREVSQVYNEDTQHTDESYPIQQAENDNLPQIIERALPRQNTEGAGMSINTENHTINKHHKVYGNREIKQPSPNQNSLDNYKDTIEPTFKLCAIPEANNKPFQDAIPMFISKKDIACLDLSHLSFQGNPAEVKTKPIKTIKEQTWF